MRAMRLRRCVPLLVLGFWLWFAEREEHRGAYTHGGTYAARWSTFFFWLRGREGTAGARRCSLAMKMKMNAVTRTKQYKRGLVNPWCRPVALHVLRIVCVSAVSVAMRVEEDEYCELGLALVELNHLHARHYTPHHES